MVREIEKRLLIEFDEETTIEQMQEMAKRMLKSLDVLELAGITSCKVEQTIAHIEVTPE